MLNCNTWRLEIEIPDDALRHQIFELITQETGIPILSLSLKFPSIDMWISYYSPETFDLEDGDHVEISWLGGTHPLLRSAAYGNLKAIQR